MGMRSLFFNERSTVVMSIHLVSIRKVIMMLIVMLMVKHD